METVEFVDRNKLMECLQKNQSIEAVISIVKSGNLDIPRTKTIITKEGIEVTVDFLDYERLNKHVWMLNNVGYAYARIKRKSVYMHKLIMDCIEDNEDGVMYDHIDGNKLNNSKSNLRKCTYSENNCNRRSRKNSSSIYKGVHISPDTKGRWIVTISKDSKYYNLGTYKDEIAAANAYNFYAPQYQGKFARLNNCPFMPKEEWEKYRTSRTRTSQYVGVCWHKGKQKWTSSISWNKEHIYIGAFRNEIDAAIAYNKKCKELGITEKMYPVSDLDRIETNLLAKYKQQIDAAFAGQ